MPVTINSSEGVVRVTVSGHVTYAEVATLMAAPGNQGGGADPWPVLVDARAVDHAPSATDLRRIVTELRHLAHDMGPIGIITDSVYVYGVARMFSVFAQAVPARVEVFRCPEQAVGWLAGLHDAA